MRLEADFSGNQSLLTARDHVHALPSPKSDIPEDDKNNANKRMESND